MANDEEKTTVDANEDSNAAGGAPAKGGSKKLIIFGGIGLAAVVIGLAVAMFVVKPMLTGSDADHEAGYAEQTEESSESPSGHGESTPKKKPKKSHGEQTAGLVYAIKDIVVNPAGTGGSRFLSVSFGFELEEPGLEEKFVAKESAVRDALITILSSKTVAQLTDAKQKEITRYQIRKRVSKLVDSEELVGVYFTDFVLQ